MCEFLKTVGKGKCNVNHHPPEKEKPKTKSKNKTQKYLQHLESSPLSGIITKLKIFLSIYILLKKFKSIKFWKYS